MIRDIVLTLPFFVCFFWSLTLLVDYKKNDRSKNILLLFMSISALLYAGHAFYFSMDKKVYTLIDPFYTFSNLAVFPLFLVYIRSLTKEGPLDNRLYWLFAPSFVFSITSAVVYILLPPDELSEFINSFVYGETSGIRFSGLALFQTWVLKSARIYFALFLIPFAYYSWMYIHQYEKKIREFYSDTEKRTLIWTGKLLSAVILAVVFAMVLNFIGKSFFVHDFTLVIAPSLIFASLLYSIGYLGQKQSFNISDYELDSSEPERGNHHDSSRSKLYEEILLLMETKQIFRNPDLRITDVSNLLKTNRTYVSGIINTEFNSTFCDMVNQYRIEYSKKLLLDRNLYILHYISEESGFASVNSFMRAFKKFTGMTPGQFRKQNITNNNN